MDKPRILVVSYTDGVKLVGLVLVEQHELNDPKMEFVKRLIGVEFQDVLVERDPFFGDGYIIRHAEAEFMASAGEEDYCYAMDSNNGEAIFGPFIIVGEMHDYGFYGLPYRVNDSLPGVPMENVSVSEKYAVFISMLESIAIYPMQEPCQA